MNWQDQSGTIPGQLEGYRVIGILGANIRSIAWLTQAICGPSTRSVAWVVGTNDVELVPPERFDDRPSEIRRDSLQRLNESGLPRLAHYKNVAFELLYSARLTATMLGGRTYIIPYEIPPRYDSLGKHRLARGFFHDPPELSINEGTYRANQLFRSLAVNEPHVHALPLLNALEDPDYYWTGSGYGMHPASQKVADAVRSQLRQ